MILVDNPLIPLLFSALVIAGMGWLIQKVVNGNKEIDKEINTAFDEIIKKNNTIITSPLLPLSEHNLGTIRDQYNDLQNYLIRAPIVTWEDIERLNALRLHQERMRTHSDSFIKSVTTSKLEFKDLTPLSEQLEKLKK